VSCHFEHPGKIVVFRFDNDQAVNAHVPHGPGSGSDIFRKTGPLQDNGDMV
jgi:hypothetical protein